jgi:hypothetical protein
MKLLQVYESQNHDFIILLSGLDAGGSFPLFVDIQGSFTYIYGGQHQLQNGSLRLGLRSVVEAGRFWIEIVKTVTWC